MQAEFLLTNETDDVACSLYRTPEGDLKIWLKVGTCLLEIKEVLFEDVIEVLLETLADIEKMNGDGNDEEV